MDLLIGKNLSKTYEKRSLLKRQKVHALYPMDMTLKEGEILALVGESGSGKSTLANLLGFLLPSTSGEIFYQGEKLTYPLQGIRRREIQMIFQNPFTTLHPNKTIGKSLIEPINLHQVVAKEEVEDYIRALLKRGKLTEDLLDRYPRELSGGQLQRVNILRALSLKPKVLIADEIITALDIPVALDILDFLQDLQEKEDLSILFISHDLAAVKKLAHRVMVLKEGQVQEEGETRDIFTHPKSAYTKKLLEAIPKL